MVVILWSVIISLVLAIVWPVVQTGINSFGVWIANSSSTSPVLAPLSTEPWKAAPPFGLHHMLTIPMNYTSFGGTYTILTGVNAGSQVFGQDPLWLAWTTDLINLKDAGDMAGYQNLLATITPARFKVGQMIGATGLLLGIAWPCTAVWTRISAAITAPCSSPLCWLYFSQVSQSLWNSCSCSAPFRCIWYTQCCRDALLPWPASSTSGFIPLATWNS